MIIARKFAFAVIAIGLVGCAGAPTFEFSAAERYLAPTPGREVTIAPGEELLRQMVRRKVRAIDVSAAASVSLATLLPGTYIKNGYVGNNQARAIYSPEDGGAAFDGVYRHVPLVIDETKGLACVYDPKSGLLLEAIDCVELNSLGEVGASYEKYIRVKGSFEQVLVYNRTVDQHVLLTYRQTGEQASGVPFSFATDLHYNLGDEPWIRYNGAVIKVIEASARGITYTVINGFGQGGEMVQ